jgi:hypothetical protein
LRGGHETFIKIDVPSAGGDQRAFFLRTAGSLQIDTQRRRGSLSLGGLTLLGRGDFSENAQLPTVLRRFRLERPRPGLHLPAGSPSADLFGRAVVKWDVTDDFPDTFWRKQDFNWFAGL